MLLESIKLENGTFHHLPYHEQRMHRAQQALFGKATVTHLADHLVVPAYARKGVYKCRIVYQEAIEQVEFIAYRPKTIRTLRRVYCDDIDYRHKYEDRHVLNELFDRRGDCDDILIIKNGLVTDTSYANIIFYDGRQWLTPAQPLLQGTQREYLLDQGAIIEAMIRAQNIPSFRQFQLINALLGADHPGQPTAHIR